MLGVKSGVWIWSRCDRELALALRVMENHSRVLRAAVAGSQPLTHIVNGSLFNKVRGQMRSPWDGNYNKGLEI